MAVVTEPVYHGTQVVGSVPTYWPAITDVPCPVCDSGTIRWAEAGYVPAYRKCDGCGRNFWGAGTAENPTLILMGRRG